MVRFVLVRSMAAAVEGVIEVAVHSFTPVCDRDAVGWPVDLNSRVIPRYSSGASRSQWKPSEILNVLLMAKGVDEWLWKRSWCKRYGQVLCCARSVGLEVNVDLEELWCGCWQALSIVSIDTVVAGLRYHIRVPTAE